MDNALRVFYACVFAAMKILPIFASEILMSKEYEESVDVSCYRRSIKGIWNIVE